MFNFVLLSQKPWFQFNSRIVRTHFASAITLNNCKIIAETRSYIFRWRSRCLLLKLPNVCWRRRQPGLVSRMPLTRPRARDKLTCSFCLAATSLVIILFVCNHNSFSTFQIVNKNSQRFGNSIFRKSNWFDKTSFPLYIDQLLKFSLAKRNKKDLKDFQKST